MALAADEVIEVRLVKVRDVAKVYRALDRWIITKLSEKKVEIYDKRARPPRVIATVKSLDLARDYIDGLVNPGRLVRFGREERRPKLGQQCPQTATEQLNRTFAIDSFLEATTLGRRRR
jgi:hypothetical protein